MNLANLLGKRISRLRIVYTKEITKFSTRDFPRIYFLAKACQNDDMITKVNLRQTIEAIGFKKTENKEFFTKEFENVDCAISVDFDDGKIIYPKEKGFIVNDGTTSNFENNENFVVMECVCRLLEKGYRPEHIELEKRWNLGHNAVGGKADICVYNEDRSKVLVIIECKTAGTEYNKARKQLLEDGGQLFSYWQQERAAEWLCLYNSDFVKTETISAREGFFWGGGIACLRNNFCT